MSARAKIMKKINSSLLDSNINGSVCHYATGILCIG
jgi:hypothetical protein